MPASPQHPAPTPSNVSGADAEDLALYREKFRRRLPESLDELHGPTHGVVDLPLHMAWSDDEAFAAYGLDDAAVTALRAWAVEWADDLAARLLEEAGDPDIE
ncbi:hypothetical protein [Streptomyces adustus]